MDREMSLPNNNKSFKNTLQKKGFTPKIKSARLHYKHEFLDPNLEMFVHIMGA